MFVCVGCVCVFFFFCGGEGGGGGGGGARVVAPTMENHM